MKPTFHHRPVNGPFEDPSVYLRVFRERRAFLFDAGNISSLSARDLMKISDVFITHTHIDHFIGFDMILRALLRRDGPVTFYGPSGIIERVERRLGGYTWNLIAEYPLLVNVVEVGKESIREAAFRAGEEFRKTDSGSWDFTPGLVDTPLLTVGALHLDHDVPSLGFSVREKTHINIDKARLTEKGFSVGPWLSELKESVREGRFDDRIGTPGGDIPVAEMEDLYTITEGQKVSYIMDSAPSEDNIARIIDFVGRSDSLYIEAYFMHKDLAHARDRSHLTARIAGRVAREGRVRHLHLLHFSPRYREDPEAVVREAMEAFRR